MREVDALPRDPIERGRADRLVAREAGVRPRLIIRQCEQDVGPAAFGYGLARRAARDGQDRDKEAGREQQRVR